MRFLLLAAATAVSACALAPLATADGLPVLGIDVGSSGVTVPGTPDRFVTVSQGNGTLVERIARDGGRILGLARVRGNFTIPAVAYDSSASGLSADGASLVLIEPRQSFPRRVTRFALLDAHTLRVRRTITLNGDFSFDAISPRGKTMFLVDYTSANDPTRYTVRAYNLRAGALLPNAIQDPAERSDKMRGSPITRLQTADGRWAYTLYDGAGGTPFVHALDTAALRAHCIDLPMLAGRQDLWSLRLSARSGELHIGGPTGELASVDLSSYVVRGPAEPGRSNLRRLLWLVGALAAAGVLVAGAIPARRRRMRGRPAAA